MCRVNISKLAERGDGDYFLDTQGDSGGRSGDGHVAVARVIAELDGSYHLGESPSDAVDWSSEVLWSFFNWPDHSKL